MYGSRKRRKGLVPVHGWGTLPETKPNRHRAFAFQPPLVYPRDVKLTKAAKSNILAHYNNAIRQGIQRTLEKNRDKTFVGG